jgi:hypothetical protein
MATILISLAFCLSLLLSSVPAYSDVFNVSSGDVTGLIAAINAANSNGEENTINLEPGTYTLTLVDNNIPDGPNGLPSIIADITINGDDAASTIFRKKLHQQFPMLISTREMSLRLLGQELELP